MMADMDIDNEYRNKPNIITNLKHRENLMSFLKPSEQNYLPPSHWRVAQGSLPLENYTPYLEKWDQIKTTICKKRT